MRGFRDILAVWLVDRLRRRAAARLVVARDAVAAARSLNARADALEAALGRVAA